MPAIGTAKCFSSTSSQPDAYSRRRMGAISPSASQPPCVSVTRVPAAVASEVDVDPLRGFRLAARVPGEAQAPSGSTDCTVPQRWRSPSGACSSSAPPECRVEPAARRRADARASASRPATSRRTRRRMPRKRARAWSARQPRRRWVRCRSSMPSIRPTPRLATERHRGATGGLPRQATPAGAGLESAAWTPSRPCSIVVFQLFFGWCGDEPGRSPPAHPRNPPPSAEPDTGLSRASAGVRPCRGCAPAGRGSCGTASVRGRRRASGSTRRWCGA